MYSKQFSTCNVLLILVLTSLTASTVLSMRCYVCSTEDGPDCYSNPRQYRTCGALAFNAGNSKDPSIFNALSNSTDIVKQADHSDSARYEYYNCGTMYVEYRGRLETVRMCTPKSTSCRDYSDSLAQEGMYLVRCNRCDGDLCNWRLP